MNELLYTVPEVARLLKTNKNFVYSLIKSGELPHLKLGSIKVRKSSLEEYVAKQEQVR